ncbi:MAG: GNAT family N-acetyltransferase [Halobacteria archaeon]
MSVVTESLEYRYKPPNDSGFLDDVWELKERVRRREGYLCQSWSFFSRAYNRNEAYLYIDGDEVVGFATVRNDGYVLFLAVDKSYRGEGVGTSLMERVQDKHTKLSCHARSSNEGAIGFYKNLGFSVDKYVERYYQNGDAAYYLTKNTSQSGSSIRNKITEVLKSDSDD